MSRTGQIAGFLSRLRRDVRGNVIAIVAASLIPLLGLIGGGVDLSRLYLTKVRLQQACDAGALAGRKAMGGGAWSQTSPSPNTVATMFFNANFKANSYGTTSSTPTFSESAGDVTGTASATVPMTLMQVFGSPTRTITVTCDTQMQLPNTDVMFVLDNTGSMYCLPSEDASQQPCQTYNSNQIERSGSKIAQLRIAVKCFYEVLAQYDTDVTCPTTTSNAGVTSGSQIRFGFVPYSTNVNVAGLGLPSSYFATNWPYQSRSVTWSSWANATGSCSNLPSNTTSTQYQTSGSGSSCKVQKRTASWTYAQTYEDLSSWSGTSVTLPIGSNYTSKTMTWDGCIEEWTPTTDINAAPSSSNWQTQYGPALPDALFLRNSSSSSLNTSSLTTATSTTTTDYYNSVRSSNYSCPQQARKIQTWAVSDFDTYVNSLKAGGNTYHDAGLLWGGRLMSPEGMMKADTALTPSGGQIQHHMIFMTDGDPQASACDYQMYGIAWYDQRTSTNVGSASSCTSTNTNLTNLVTTRMLALCNSIKNEPNTTLWVISFGGTGIATDTKTNLASCATDSSHYFDATSSASLQSAFQLIAAQISQLRLTQ